MSPLHHYFTLTEAARLVHRSPATLRGRIFRRKIQAHQVGHTWWIHREELQKQYPDALKPPGAFLPDPDQVSAAE